MKRKIQYKILILEAVLLAWLAIMPKVSYGIFSEIIDFPFKQIGLGLRALSLSGAVGNIIAVLLYIAVCLSPLLYLYLRKSSKHYMEDILVPVLSLTLFLVIYQMINPNMNHYLGLTVYSILIGYAILRMLRIIYIADFDQLGRYIYTLLFILNIIFVFAISYVGISEIMESINRMHIDNSGNYHLFNINYIFLGLGAIVKYLHYILNILIVFSAMPLLQELKIDRHSEETIAAGKALSKVCRQALSIIVLTNIGYNILQLLFRSKIFTINSYVNLPLFSILFVLACLLLVQLLEENRFLKDESDSII